MKNIIVFLSVLILSASLLYAVENASSGSTKGGDLTKVGATGAQFLKIDVGARGAAMAGAYGSVTNDLTSIYWNCAGLADVSSVSADFSYTQWFANFSHNFVGVAIPISDGYTVALSYTGFGANNIKVTTVEKPEGTGATYNINDMSAAATFSGYLTKQFSFGVTAKYISNSFASVASSGLAFDIGTMYDTELYGVKLGFAIQNLGLEQKYQGQDLRTMTKMYQGFSASPIDAEYMSYTFDVPLMFRASISSEIINSDGNYLLVAGDFLTASDSKEQFMLGAEYTWNDLLSLRAGYRFNHDQFGFSGGIGLKYMSGSFGGRLDYSISPTYSLGLINRLSVALNFGS
ncbi:MAG: PorV/PorQ family protein [bacterium]